jgi:hypothetical protein
MGIRQPWTISQQGVDTALIHVVGCSSLYGTLLQRAPEFSFSTAFECINSRLSGTVDLLLCLVRNLGRPWAVGTKSQGQPLSTELYSNGPRSFPSRRHLNACLVGKWSTAVVCPYQLPIIRNSRSFTLFSSKLRSTVGCWNEKPRPALRTEI